MSKNKIDLDKVLKIEKKLGFEFTGIENDYKHGYKNELYVFENKDIKVLIDNDYVIYDFSNSYERKNVVNGIITPEQVILDRKNVDMLGDKAGEIVDILTEDMIVCEECGELIGPNQKSQMMYGLTENEYGETILDLNDEMGIAHTDCLEMFNAE